MEEEFDAYIKNKAKLQTNYTNAKSFINGAIEARAYLRSWNIAKNIIPKHNNSILLMCNHKSGVHNEKSEIFYVVGYYDNGKFDFDYSYNEPPFEVLGWREIN